MVPKRLMNKKIDFEADECKGIWKILGLMFRKQATAKTLIFNFKTPKRRSIHSLFCPYFLAIWLLKGKIVDYRFVKKNQLSVKPSSIFDTLIEVPLNRKNENIIKHFRQGKIGQK
jgi:hypothetical protein